MDNGIVNFLFDFKGRVRRRDFWVYFILIWILTPITFWSFAGFHRPVSWHDHSIFLWHTPSLGHSLLGAALSIALFWSNLAVLSKRWHDRNKSGWWTLITLIPFIGWLWLLIECGFLEGSTAENRYGPSPK